MPKRPSAVPLLDEGDFYPSINSAIEQGRHLEQLHAFIRQFEEYKSVFAASFVPVDVRIPPRVLTFKVEYTNKRPVWRVFEALGSDTFNDLAEAIIESMGWDNDHMHGFGLPERRGREIRYVYSAFSMYAPGWEDDPHPTYRTEDVYLANLNYDRYPKLGFIFDFGAGHEFSVHYKGDRPRVPEDTRECFPVLIDQRGVGPCQYEDFG